MNEKQCELKKIMQDRFAKAQLKNASFSLRSFAKYIDATPSSVSEFFNNKRNFSDKKIIKILERLGMSPLEINNFDEKFNSSNAKVDRLRLDSDVFFLVSNPIYYTLLALIETKKFVFDIAKIAKRIKASESEIQVAIEKLIELNLVIKNKNKLKVNTPHLDTISGVTSATLRLRHQRNLEDAQNALHNLATEDRFFAFETLAVDKDKLPEVEALMFKFLDELHLLVDGKNKTEVYEFCFQYFPRTTNVPNRKEQF